MAWISGLLQSFRGPSRIARSASAAAADAGAEENAAATESGGRRRERRVRARSITASLDGLPAAGERTPDAAGSPPLLPRVWLLGAGRTGRKRRGGRTEERGRRELGKTVDGRDGRA